MHFLLAAVTLCLQDVGLKTQRSFWWHKTNHWIFICNIPSGFQAWTIYESIPLDQFCLLVFLPLSFLAGGPEVGLGSELYWWIVNRLFDLVLPLDLTCSPTLMSSFYSTGGDETHGPIKMIYVGLDSTNRSCSASAACISRGPLYNTLCSHFQSHRAFAILYL